MENNPGIKMGLFFLFIKLTTLIFCGLKLRRWESTHLALLIYCQAQTSLIIISNQAPRFQSEIFFLKPYT